ncbi:MAG: hypothetical protein DRO93_08675 [Candidatus Thorarchaeota archaeon]|nr:MAG: hypothetical protein DRO93_08675 [Candidatus Thorarchaeota archaeon]
MVNYIFDNTLQGCRFRIHRRIGYRYYDLFGEFLRQNYDRLREIGEPFALAHRFISLLLREGYITRYEVRGRIRYRVIGRVCTYLEILIIGDKTYMEFVYVFTFVETGKSVIKRRYFLNTRTGQVIHLKRGRPPIGISRILEEWRRRGELRHVVENEARKIEIHFESEIRPDVYEEMKDKIREVVDGLLDRADYSFILELARADKVDKTETGEEWRPESWAEAELFIKRGGYVETRFEIKDLNYGISRAGTPWVARLPLRWWELSVGEIVDYF